MLNAIKKEYLMKLGMKYLPMNPNDDEHDIACLEGQMQKFAEWGDTDTAQHLKDIITVIRKRDYFKCSFGNEFDFKPFRVWTLADFTREYNQRQWQLELDLKELEYDHELLSLDLSIDDLCRQYNSDWQRFLLYCGDYVPDECFDWCFGKVVI